MLPDAVSVNEMDIVLPLRVNVNYWNVERERYEKQSETLCMARSYLPGLRHWMRRYLWFYFAFHYYCCGACLCTRLWLSIFGVVLYLLFAILARRYIDKNLFTFVLLLFEMVCAVVWRGMPWQAICCHNISLYQWEGYAGTWADISAILDWLARWWWCWKHVLNFHNLA